MDDLLSDFSMDNGVFPVDGRTGGWYTYADKSGFGTLDPPEGGAAPPDLDTGNPNCSGPGTLHVISIGVRRLGLGDGGGLRAEGARSTPAARAKGTYDAIEVPRHRLLGARGGADPVRAGGGASTRTRRSRRVCSAEPSAACTTAAMPAMNCSPYLVKFGYGYMGEALTPVMEDFPKFIGTQIDTTWRRFEILFADMKQDSTNPGRPSPDNTLAVSQITGMAIQVNTDHSTSRPPRPTGSCGWTTSASSSSGVARARAAR